MMDFMVLVFFTVVSLQQRLQLYIYVFFRVMVLRTHPDRETRPRQPLRVAPAQSGLLAQQNSFAHRNSNTLKVCDMLTFFSFFFMRKHCRLPCGVYCSFIGFQVIMMQRRSLMKMRTMFLQKIGKRSVKTVSLMTKKKLCSLQIYNHQSSL